VSDAPAGIRVEYSNRIERLVDSLAEALEANRGLGRIFEPPRVVVPNRNVEKFLKFELADRFGIVGDIEFTTLEAWLRDALPEEVVPLDEQRLRSALIGLLSTERFLANDAMRPVAQYLQRADGQGRALRVYQLAERLARNFREYGYSRTRMIDQWLGEEDLYTPDRVDSHDTGEANPYVENERWQRYLWRTLFSEGGLLQQASDEGRRLDLFTNYWRTLDPQQVDLNGPVYLFGLSHLAPVYGQIFERLKSAVMLRFFVLNPCAEYWEDVIYEEEEEVYEAGENSSPKDMNLPLQARRGPAAQKLDISPRSFEVEQGQVPLALKVWGRAGRDHNHMLNRLTGYSFETNWEPTAGLSRDDSEPTLLETFQTDVLRFEPAHSSDLAPEADDSVRFVQATGVRRELEAVADQIWTLVREHDDIDFNDIAVVVNPRKREEYQMHLEAVFEEVRGIPFNLVDVQRGDGSRLFQAIELLLKLPLGEFDRHQLGALLSHPNLAAKYPEADPDEWARWCEELAIFRGADAEDLEGTHVDRDLYNWDQGVTRLVLGSFLEQTEGRRGRSQPFEMDGQTYIPSAPDDMAEAGAAGRWIELVRQLIGEARATRDHDDSLGGWCRWMADWIEQHLAPANPSEKAELAGYLDALRSASDTDLSTIGESDDVAYRTAVEFARKELASQTYERGHYLATGVVVSSFVPQRPIPFDAIFMTGLDADDFPGSSPRTPVDLRTAKWEEGDLWERDRERYMFFETLLSARQRVTCSWVARDPVTGEGLEPSSVVREFQHILEQYVGEEGIEDLVVEHPLRRYNEAYFYDDSDGRTGLAPTFNPSAHHERRALHLRRELLNEIGGPQTAELDLHSLLDDELKDGELRQTFELVSLPDAVPDTDETRSTRELGFSALRRFIESPLQAWAQYRLGLNEEDEEALLEKTTEPFELSTLDEVMILRAAFEEGASGGSDEIQLADQLRDKMSHAALEGRAPTGTYGRVEENRLGGVGQAWAQQLAGEPDARRTRFRFGAPQGEDDIEAREALRLEIESGDQRQTLDLTGDTALAAPEESTLYIPSRQKRYEIGWRRALRGWVQGLVLTAAGIFEDDTFKVVLLHRQGSRKPKSALFDCKGPTAAKKQLAELAHQLWFDSHAYRFALSELEQAFPDPDERVSLEINPVELRAAVWRADNGGFGQSSDAYGPIPNVHRYDIPTEDADQLTAMVERRMGPFVRTMLEANL
jgi:exodeoxyribonuclease V gamma subunit